MKIDAGKTYFYTDFISEEERLTIKEWALRNEGCMIPNPSGPFRVREIFKKIPEKLDLLDVIKKRIIEIEGIGEDYFEPLKEDFVSIHRNGSKVVEHLDINPDDTTLYSRRYNVFISLPENGGLPIYDNEIINVTEKCLLRSESGVIPHSTTVIQGDIPRIILSYGFAFKK